jgi:hypothetical protein
MVEDNTQTEKVRVRKAPKLIPFMTVGTTFGVLLGVGAYFVVPESARTDANILGVLVVFLGAIGFMSGTLMALVFDWVSRARSQELEATKLKG